MEYKVDGRYMTVKITKADLGLSGNDYTINFSWTDNVHDEGDYSKFSGDIMDFYISGDVAPGGRFKYSYISTSENSGDVPAADTETVEDTDAATDAPADSATDAVTDGEPVETDAAEEEGCKSSVTFGAALVLISVAAASAVVISFSLCSLNQKFLIFVPIELTVPSYSLYFSNATSSEFPESSSTS